MRTCPRAFASAIEPAAIAWGEHHDVDELDDEVSRAEAALAEGRTGDVALANQQFHRRIVAGMGSRTLDETMDRLLAQMRLVFLQVLKKEPGFHGDFVAVNRHVVDLMSVSPDWAEDLPLSAEGFVTDRYRKG